MCFYLREMLEEQYPAYISESKLQEMYGKLYQHPGGRHTTNSVGGAQAFPRGESWLLPQPTCQWSGEEGRWMYSQPVRVFRRESAPSVTGAGEMYSQQSYLSYMFPYKYF